MRVLIVGDHPHAGKSGDTVRVEETPIGTGLVVQLDDGLSCFVFDKSNIVSLEKPTMANIKKSGVVERKPKVERPPKAGKVATPKPVK